MRTRLLALVALLAFGRTASGAEEPGWTWIEVGGPPEDAKLWGPGLWAVTDAKVVGNGYPVPEAGAAPFELFELPEVPRTAAPDVIQDYVARLVPELQEREGYRLELHGSRLLVRADAATTSRVREVAAAAVAALDPRLTVSATLVAEDGGSHLVASGAGRLHPRAWTRLWRYQHDRPFVVDYDVEIAQESTANDPVVIEPPEGSEAYVRWTPGETASLLEVWTGVLDHLEPTTLDMSGVRNAPESSSISRLELPKTAVRRALTVLALPGGQASRHEIVWEGAGGKRVLRLSAGAAERPPEPLARRERAYGVLRLGALTAPLEGSKREGSLEAWMQLARELRSPDDSSLDTRDAFVLVDAPAALFTALRGRIAEEERRLTPAVLEVRAVAVGEDALRTALEAGSVVVGAPLPVEADASLLAGATLLGLVRLPVVAGIPAGVRVGVAEICLADAGVEVAQQAGALDIGVKPVFAGLAGTANVVPTPTQGVEVEFTGTFGWRAADAATELAFRPPVGMAFNREGVRTEDPQVRRVRFPIGAAGQAFLDATATLSADALRSGRPALLAVLSRPGGDAIPDTVLLLTTLR